MIERCVYFCNQIRLQEGRALLAFLAFWTRSDNILNMFVCGEDNIIIKLIILKEKKEIEISNVLYYVHRRMPYGQNCSMIDFRLKHD